MSDEKKPMFTIDADPSTRVIRVGKWVADGLYYNYPVSEGAVGLKHTVLAANGVEIKHKSTLKAGLRHVHSEIASYLGGRFYAQLRKVFVDTWINPNRELLKKHATLAVRIGMARFIPGQVVRSFEVDGGLQWLQRYDWEHMMPLVLYFGEHPQQLKKKLGKALWSTLCGQPKTRLQYFAALLCGLDECDHAVLFKLYPEQVKKTLNERAGSLPDETFANRVSMLKSWLPLKSAMLKLRMYAMYSMFKSDLEYELMYDGEDPDMLADDEEDYDLNKSIDTVPARTYLDKMYQMLQKSQQETAWLNAYGSPSNIEKFNDIRTILKDTKRMSILMGRRFEYCNPRQMTIRHRMLNQMLKKKAIEDQLKRDALYDKPFPGIEHYIDAISAVSLPGVEVRVLSCPVDLMKETEEQDHCVYEKVHHCHNMQLIVLSLRSEKQRTTLGFRLDKSRNGAVVSLYQHYSHNNTKVVCNSIKSAVPVLQGVIAGQFDRLCRKVA